MGLKGDLNFKTITIPLTIINRVYKSVIVFSQWIPLNDSLEKMLKHVELFVHLSLFFD